MNATKSSDMYDNAKPGRYPDQKFTSYSNQDSKARALTAAISRLKTRLKRPKGNAVPPKGKGSGQAQMSAVSPTKAQPSPAGNTQLWQTRARGTTERRPLGASDRSSTVHAETRPLSRGGTRG